MIDINRQATTIDRRRQREEPQEGNYFVSAYPPFSCWSKENVVAAERVLETPSASEAGVPLGLYLHIPFCARRCQYCYYLSYAAQSREQIDRYLDALITEAAIYGDARALAGRHVTFVYFGGGTPSLLSRGQIGRVMRSLQSAFSFDRLREMTFECAPQSVTLEKLSALREAGVTRLSLGVQQLDDDVLRLNGRTHRRAHVRRAYAAIRRVGFPTVNVDLMVGMVGETDASFRESLERVIEMQPESVTIYQLEIPFNTPLYRMLRAGNLQSLPAVWAVKRARLAAAFARLEEIGYTLPSAYAAVRDPAHHPFLYQDLQYRGADLLGLGVASFSYLAGVHHQNLASRDTYLASLSEGKLPLGRAYRLSDEERLVREFVLQLKLGSIETQYFRSKFGIEVAKRFAEPLKRFADEGWLRFDNKRITLTRRGLLRVDSLIPDFYLPQHQAVRYS